MADIFTNTNQVVNEALARFNGSSQALDFCTKKYEGRFANKGAQIGVSVDIPRPTRYNVTNGADITSAIAGGQGEFQSSTVTLTINRQKVIPLQISDLDLTMKMDDFSEQVLAPQMERLARDVDFDIMSVAMQSAGYRPSRTVTNSIALADVVKANAYLGANFAPKNRGLFLDAFGHADMVDTNKGLFQSSTEIANQYEKGIMGISGGFKWYSSESLPVFTASGTITGTTVNGAVANNATTIVFAGVTGATSIKAGASFTVAGIFEIDPQTLTARNRLKVFTVVSDATVTAGAATVTVAEALTYTGNRSSQNLAIQIPNGAAVTFLEAAAVGLSGQIGLALAEGAIAFASVDLEMPGLTKYEQRSNMNGVSMRITKGWDVLTSKSIWRAEILYGLRVLRPEFIASIMGKVQ
jgi:hypothetical protein